jgi:signal transduction histidine kinase
MAASLTASPSRDGLRSRLARNPLVVDALIAAALTALSLVTILGGALDFSQTDALGLTLALLQTVPLVLRRRYPVAVFAITISALGGHALIASGSFNSSLGSLVALFTVAEQCSRRTGILAAIVGASVITGVILLRVGVPAGLSGLVQSLLTVFVVWIVGTWAQERRRYIGTVEERARRAEAEREARAALAVAEERGRIARELHDVVTHHVSVIVIQAGAGLRALDGRPRDTRTALEAIDSSGRRALADMRRMLGILAPDRPAANDDDAAAGGAVPAPMPGLDRLGELLDQVRATGLRTELSVVGTPRPLDAGVELSAYRIVQEALTNTLKHAPDARAAVTIRYRPEALEVEVVNDAGSGGVPGDAGGPLAHPGEAGRGLIGMRERVGLFGGTLQAGPDAGGFRVIARLPVEEAAASTPAERDPGVSA